LPDQDSTKPASTSRTVWRLAWPTILSNLLFATVGFMHIKIVANLGTGAVAAVTTGHRVFFLVQAILMGLSIATTAMVARSWGAKDQRGAELATWTSMALGMALAASLSLPILLAPEFIAGLFGLDAQTTRTAASFVFWLGLFNIPAAINLILSSALRATGDVINPLWFLFFSSVFNVVFAYLLTFGIGPLPQLGVAGVALGGGLAGFAVTLLFLLFWWWGKFSLKPVKQAVIDWIAARQMIYLAAPAVIEQGIVQLAFLAFFAIVARYGTSAYAAYGIGISLVSFSIVVAFGFSIAAATLVGQHLGAGQPKLAIKAGWRGLRMALVAMVLTSVLIAFFAHELAAFMIDDEEVIHLTTVFLYMIAISQPLIACEITLAGALRGAGDTRFPLIATFCGIVLGRLLPALLFVSLGLSVYWIFGVMILDYSIKAGLNLHRYHSLKWLDIRLASSPGDNSIDTILDSDKNNT